jgi:hypothetical protein
MPRHLHLLVVGARPRARGGWRVVGAGARVLASRALINHERRDEKPQPQLILEDGVRPRDRRGRGEQRGIPTAVRADEAVVEE